MAENESQKGEGKTDWSVYESLTNAGQSTGPAPEAEAPLSDGAIVPAGGAGVPASITQSYFAPPDFAAQEGLMVQWRAGKLKRQATLAALEKHFDAQLDVLGHRLAARVTGEKSMIDESLDNFLRRLDEKRIEVLRELGMRNLDNRSKALMDLTAINVARVKEVIAKDWPDSAKRQTIADLNTLLKRINAEMMQETGRKYAKD